MPLPAALSNSHPNGGRVFLIFVADPRTVRLYEIRQKRATAVYSCLDYSIPGDVLTWLSLFVQSFRLESHEPAFEVHLERAIEVP
jgi:hypothetical protein